MNIRVVKVYAITFGVLGLMGLIDSISSLWIMNVDIISNLIKIILSALLAYAGFVIERNDYANLVLIIIGLILIVMGLTGIVAPTLGGIMPTGITEFEIVFYFVIGSAAIGAVLAEKESALSQ